LPARFTFTLAFEKVKRAGKITDDQVKIPVTVPIYGERPSADVLNPILLFNGNNKRFLVRTLKRFSRFEVPVLLSPQDLKQPRHRFVLARIRARKNVALSITVEVH